MGPPVAKVCPNLFSHSLSILMPKDPDPKIPETRSLVTIGESFAAELMALELSRDLGPKFLNYPYPNARPPRPA